MASNIVEILIGAKDDAKLDLDSLKQKLTDLAHQVAEAKVKLAGDKEAEVALDRLGAKLISYGKRTESAKIGLDGQFKVLAELGGVDLALDRIREKADGAGSGGGAVASLRNLAMQGSTALETLGSAGTTFINPITIALGALAAIISGPLLASLLPITLGFAAFAAIAVPEITKVWKAVDQGGAALKKLSPDERALAGPIDSLKDQFGKLAKSVQPQILQGFATALRIIKDLMPVLAPLAKAAGKAIDGFLKNIENWLKSDSGKKFIKWMETDGPNAIRTFGKVMWDVAQGVGRTFDFLRNAGDTWWKNVHATISHVMHAWDDLTHAASAVAHAVGGAFADMESLVSGAISGIIGLVHTLVGALSAARSAVSGFGGVSGLLGHLGLAAGGISGAATGGIRSSMTLVGEHGPELVQLSAGSRVYNNSQTKQMLGGGGGGGPVIIQITGSRGGSSLDAALVNWIQNHVRTAGGGDVQVAFGAAS